MANLAKVKSNKRNWFKYLFVFGVVFFSICYIDIWHTPNPISRALPVLTYYELGTLEITRYEQLSLDKSKVEEKYYSDKAPLPTLVTIPFYFVLDKLGLDKWEYKDPKFKSAPVWYSRLTMVIFLGSIICSVLPFIFMILYAFKLGGHYKFKSTLLILSFFGTYLFIYAGTYFNHIVSGFGLAFATYFITKEKRIWLSGLFCAFAFLSEYTLGMYAAILPLFLLLKPNRWKQILWFFIGFSPSIVVYCWYNYSITGNPFTFIFYYTDFETFSQGIKQNYGFGLPSLESIYGLLLSPYMGIIWFFPVLIFFLNFWRRKKWKELLTNPVFASSMALFALISCYFIWWGGYSWGPRYLIPLACILALHSPIIWERLKNKTIALSVLVISFFIQFADKSTVLFLIPDRLSNEGEASYPLRDVVWKAMQEGSYNANNIFTYLLDIQAKSAAILFIIVFIAWLVGLEFLYRKQYLQR